MKKIKTKCVNKKPNVRILSRFLARNLTQNEIRKISGGECNYSSSVLSKTMNNDQNDVPGMICS